MDYAKDSPLRHFTIRLMPVADIMLSPLVYPAAWVLKMVRRAGVHRMPVCRNALYHTGVFPIVDHYYEPQFDLRKLKHHPSQERTLPGIDWNIDEQLALLAAFTHTDELRNLPRKKIGELEYYLDNTLFESGDAEYWYQLIRYKKPKRIFEIGSGNSTLIAIKALNQNRLEDPTYQCKHVCIEPYEMPWLEKTGVSVLRSKVEDTDLAFFAELETDDILFIDSSHIIRPEGDVLFEFLELLPTLNKGVIVHIHDIRSPRNYLHEWLVDEVRLWNEQYILEAFLTQNRSWKIIGAINYLRHNYYGRLQAVAPHLTPSREPGSFYIQRTD